MGPSHYILASNSRTMGNINQPYHSLFTLFTSWGYTNNSSISLLRTSGLYLANYSSIANPQEYLPQVRALGSALIDMYALAASFRSNSTLM